MSKTSLKLDPQYREKMRKAIAMNLKKLREGHGLTVREFAAIVGINPATVSMLENGKRALKMVDYGRIIREFPHVQVVRFTGWAELAVVEKKVVGKKVVLKAAAAVRGARRSNAKVVGKKVGRKAGVR